MAAAGLGGGHEAGGSGSAGARRSSVSKQMRRGRRGRRRITLRALAAQPTRAGGWVADLLSMFDLDSLNYKRIERECCTAV